MNDEEINMFNFGCHFLGKLCAVWKKTIPVSDRDIQTRVHETESSGGLSSLEKAGIGVGVIAAIFIGKAIYDKVNEDEIGEQAHKDWQTKGPLFPSDPLGLTPAGQIY